MSKIKRILIANRGEIACRIIRTCERLGIETVAVYSDADSEALHTKHATSAAHIGASPTSASYLNTARILEVARQYEVDAIHPGYGFLSENASFAQAVIDAGIRFIGPTPETLRQLGDKQQAKLLAEKAGAPTIPGSLLPSLTQKQLAAVAKTIGLPLVIKALHGGGGRGMRIVHTAAELSDAAARAQAEALSFFGSGELLAEKLVAPALHIEVQLIGDLHGNVAHLYERECSLQRRNQKVIEEAPAAFLPEATRTALHTAAVHIGKVAGVSSLTTVEFLVSKTDPGQFYFLEANPRIQVEHPVTEEILGLDLVQLQIAIAEGTSLGSLALTDKKPCGHAIEARLYAECPERDFQPSIGALNCNPLHFTFPASQLVRIDHALEEQQRVTQYYDSLLAKVICRGESREQARAQLQATLKTISCFGLYTNRAFLEELLSLADEQFIETKAIDRLLEAQAHASDATENSARTALIGALITPVALAKRKGLYGEVNPRAIAQHFSITTPSGSTHTFLAALDSIDAQGNCALLIDGQTHTAAIPLLAAEHFLFTTASHQHLLQPCPRVWGQHTPAEVLLDGMRFIVTAQFVEQQKVQEAVLDVRSPLPGKVLQVLVRSGEAVTVDQPLVIVESMKIEHTISAPIAGTVAAVHCKVHTVVSDGEVLIEFAQGKTKKAKASPVRKRKASRRQN